MSGFLNLANSRRRTPYDVPKEERLIWGLNMFLLSTAHIGEYTRVERSEDRTTVTRGAV